MLRVRSTKCLCAGYAAPAGAYEIISSGGGENRNRNGLVLLSGSFKMIKQPDELLCCVRQGDVIVLAFRTLLFKISPEGRLPVADISCRIDERPAQILRATLFHFCVGGIKLTGLICSR